MGAKVHNQNKRPTREYRHGPDPPAQQTWGATVSEGRGSRGHRDLLILEELDRHSNVSQRELADRVGVAVSLINRHVRRMIDGGYMHVVNRNVRPFEYELTPSGRRYRRRLRHDHFRSVVGSFREVEKRITQHLFGLKKKGATRVVFYGAGAVMEVAYPLAIALGLGVIGVVDDDPGKQGIMKGGLVVDRPDAINGLAPDAVLITTFRHADEILQRMDRRLRSSVLVAEL